MKQRSDTPQEQPTEDKADLRLLRFNIMGLGSLQIINYIIPLLYLPHIIRAIGTQEYGQIVLALAVIGYFSMLADFGFGYSAVHAVASNQNDKKKLGEAGTAIIAAKILLATISWLSAFAIFNYADISPDLRRALNIASPIILANALNITWYFQGAQKLKEIISLQIAIRASGLFLVFTFIKDPASAVLLLGIEIYMATATTAASWILFSLARPFKLTKPTAIKLRETIIDSAPLFASSLFTSLYTNALTIILGLTSTRTEVAYFAIADRIVSAIKRLLNPLLQALFPHIVKLTSKDHQLALNFLNPLFKRIFITTAAISALLGLFSQTLIAIIGGQQASPALPVLLAMSPQPLLVALSNVLGVQLLFAFGYAKNVAKAQLLIGVVASISALFIGSFYGALGIALTTTSAEILIVLAFYFISKKYLEFPKILRQHTPTNSNENP